MAAMTASSCTINARVAPASSSVSLRGTPLMCNKRNNTVSYKPLKIEAALGQKAKEEQVAALKAKIDDSLLVVGMTYQGMSVAQVMAFRRSLPADANFVVSKNTLMKRAVDGTKFEAFGDALKGPNAFLMVGEEGMKDALKACTTTQKAMKKSAKPIDIHYSVGCLDGTLFTPEELVKLEDLPSKQELMAKIAGMVKQVPTKVALAVNAMPRKVGYAAAALKDKLAEEEGSS
eukprot:CAMPEP_0114254414 /NCGR_PEP_ID=MMETSP0058-20121206/16964_1 /TAXON_ID=36894 /ORGANISM="Pyramimonas parkeae, CCMP726" /LENGTH=231 /DNA_ID=CAMNT_0001368627 /DNA_START=60 /DNA_END=755 /DNA_ORIENTATION=-